MKNAKFESILMVLANAVLPYLLFAGGLVMLIVGANSRFIHHFDPPNWPIVFAVFGMIGLLVGCAATAKAPATAELVGTFSIGKHIYEVRKYGDKDYGIAEKGSYGAGMMVLNFFINIILTPIMLIYALVVIIIILCSEKFAELYREKGYSNGQAAGSAIFLVAYVFIIPYISINAGYRHKCDLNDLSVSFSNYQYHGYEIRTGWGVKTNTYAFDLSYDHPSKQLQYIESTLSFLVKGEPVEFSIFNNSFDRETLVQSLVIGNVPISNDLYFDIDEVDPKDLTVLVDIRKAEFKRGTYDIFAANESIHVAAATNTYI